jgi:Glycosyltransferase family 28 C-terminal domain
LVSFSTTFQDQSEALQRVINALGGIDIDAVVTTGPALDGVTLHAPKNVTLLHSAPHDVVMKEASLVITHGGHGIVRRALIHGLPLLVMPMGRDQNDNARRVEARGAGLSLPPSASEAEISRTLQQLATQPHFRIAARRLGEGRERRLVRDIVGRVRLAANRIDVRVGRIQVAAALQVHWRDGSEAEVDAGLAGVIAKAFAVRNRQHLGDDRTPRSGQRLADLTCNMIAGCRS